MGSGFLVRMARYSHLEIYQASYRLHLNLYRARLNLPKTLKYDLGEKATGTTLNILRYIVVANGSTDKLKYLHLLSLEIETLWVHLRLLHDLEGISRAQFQFLSDELGSLAKQSVNWVKWAKSQTAPTGASPQK